MLTAVSSWKKVMGLLVIVVLTLALTAACAPAPDDEEPAALPQVDEGVVSVDGDNQGYPQGPLLEVGEAEVYAAHDGSHVFVWARAQGEGWVAVGFNEAGRGMDGANMILGNVENADEIRNDLGEARDHAEVPNPGIEESVIETDPDEVIMEFSYPLQFPDNEFALSALEPGEEFSLLLSYQADSRDPGDQHTAQTMADFLME